MERNPSLPTDDVDLSDFDIQFNVYHELMGIKVQEILLVSSPYDAYIMEEDGSLASKIINEYRGLNLSRPPRLTWTASPGQALELLDRKNFDLVITMPNLDDKDMDAFALSMRIKNKMPDLPIILLRQGVSARAIMDDVSLLKKIETRAILHMNSVQAIAGSIEAGLGCVIGTRLFMQDQLQRGIVRARPIIDPELSRTLYLCHLASRPPTFASEAIRRLLLSHVIEAVSSGHWEAQLVSGGPIPD